MLKIRLARIGKKKQPYYRIVISEQARDTYGRALEILGSYNPRSKQTDIKKERVKYWLSQGAQTSATIHNLLINNNIIEGKKVAVTHLKEAKKAKPEEKNAAEKGSKPEAAAQAEKKEKTAQSKEKTEANPANNK
ncbi:30S ribosomal protein S16 [Candidatus Falkowbacteria bacterium CG10_big_fil_rev_8_21_14_0_10_43_10]|uniref:Small ribosomal subunit protein bS16 n=1 Tax=Candidatus Falkowbacteria bacterium CG10_big_fil_rev_8_21_14_0_10_43_10 TaxID=1974567 RepID=A0A2H0V202_9BACT|nr:MAG: 30S ribosomal protein S16 [Candidatus Falkowbacteria bacterium CG10_big_fil_rev_8_21_14_0_10_43_10]